MHPGMARITRSILARCGGPRGILAQLWADDIFKRLASRQVIDILAIRARRRQIVPLVQPDMCGVITRFRNS